MTLIKRNFKILFTDLDGTMLNSRSQLTESVKTAVADATAAGKRVVLCSGRSWRSLDFFERELGLFAPGCYGIAFNGGVVYETFTKKFLFCQTMENALAQDIIRELKKLGADALVYAGEYLYAERETPDLNAYTDMSRIKAVIVNDFTSIQDDIMKIILRDRPDRLTDIAQRMSALYTGRCSVFFSAADLLEFSHPDAHKGRAFSFLADYLGIPLGETIAAGDQANDVSMLETAGLGVAVGNAAPAARAAADVVLRESCDENAVSRVIYDYLLKD